jgi:hypothetical protein|tara:strand:+ start:25316 stop:25477 length:162 start_codon:yes stop_codon:yes gene_type:complete
MDVVAIENECHEIIDMVQRITIAKKLSTGSESQLLKALVHERFKNEGLTFISD